MRPLNSSQVLTAIIVTIVLSVLVSATYINSIQSNKISGYAGLTYNKTGLCGNNDVDIEADEQCDGLADSKCAGRCDNRICMCFAESEKRSKELGTLYEYYYFFDKMESGESNFVQNDKPGISFTQLNFTVNNTQKELKVIVNTNASWPASLKKFDSGTTYQLFRVWLHNITGRNITSATMQFRVPKAWIAEGNYSRSDITLRRHSEVYFEYHYEWEKITPKPVGEDGSYYKYEAEIKLPAYFAVVAEKPAICGNLVCEKDENTANCCTDCGVWQSNEACTNNIVAEIKCGDNYCDTSHNESTANCCIDCGCPETQACEFNTCQILSLCGNNICESSESATNCIQDCGSKVFFSPIFLIIIIALSAVAFFVFREFKNAKPEKRRGPIFTDKDNEEDLRERVKELIGRHHAHNMREILLKEGWNKQLVEKILRQSKVEFDAIMPESHDLYAHIISELKTKPISAIKAELLGKGWPAGKVDSAMRKIMLLSLANKYSIHEGSRDSEKFNKFAEACRQAGGTKEDIKEVLVYLGWSQHIVERALKQIFGDE